MSFTQGTQAVLVDVFTCQRAARDGWAWADVALVREVPGSLQVWHVDETTGKRRLVAVRASSDDKEAVREIMGRNRKLVFGDPRPVRRGDVVGSEQIAQRLGVKLDTVTKWAERHENFPEPIVRVGGAKVYDWREVEAWARRRTAKQKARKPA